MNNLYLISLLLFILGCLFGSFLSVLVHRTLNRQKGIIFGKSRCPKCKHALHALDLIPILSWLLKGGRCSYCKKPISAVYPSLELVTGLLFVTNFNMIFANTSFDFFNSYLFDPLMVVKLLFLCLVCLNLMAIFFSDLQKKSIPTLFLYSWVILTAFTFLLTGTAFADALISRGFALLVAALLFGGQYLISKGKWLGSGDLYLAAGMALFLGLNKFLLAVVICYLLGSLISLCLLALRRVSFKQTVPFAPFLIMGTLIALYQGNEIVYWYLHYLMLT